ncbi:MAG: hypothetical protein K6T66_08720 [Peptococcaceae bacterium]|nr:hypothetical protein [Peptococcaceae bacterium]
MGREAFKMNGGGSGDPGRESFAFENFQGVDIISDNTALPKKMVPFAKNVDFSKRIGAAAKRDGIKKLIDSLGTGGCIGIHNYRSAAGDRVLFGWGNALYMLAGTSATLTKSEQTDWQAGQGYNTDLTSSPGDIKMAAAPSNTFTRNTAAYTSDGVKVSNNIPRYEKGLFDKGVLIEGAATNLLSNPLFAADTTGWNKASMADWSYTGTAMERKTDGGAVGTTYVKLGDGANSGKGMATANNITVAAGGVYNISFYMKVADLQSQAIVCIRTKDGAGANNSASVTPPDGWVYSPAYDSFYKLFSNSEINKWERHEQPCAIPAGAASLQASIQYYTGGDKYINVSAPQFVNCRIATTFTDGTRDGDLLSYAVPALPAEFVIGGVLKPEWDSTAYGVGDGYNVLAYLKNDVQNDYKVLLISNAADGRKGKICIEKQVGGARTDLVGANALSFKAGDAIRWAAAQLTQAYGDLAAGMHLWVRVNNGAVEHYSLNHTASVPNLTACYLGSNGSNSNYVNGTIDDFFIEGIAARNVIGQPVNSASLEGLVTSGSAYSVSAATILYVSGDSTITAPRCPGVWLSPVYDLGSNPEIASIAWTAAEPASTDCSLKIRSSADNSTFGTWQAVSSGGSIPLLRYQQIRVDLTTGDRSATPSFSEFTITYESSLNQAVAVKTGLPGTKIRFTNYDNKCYWCAGGRLQVFDGTTNRDVGTDPPATAPTLTASGTGLTGKYKGAVTFVTAEGFESNPSPFSAEINLSNQGIQWSNIPTGGARVVKRNLYRTKAGGADYYFIATLNDNVTAAYTDTTADTALVTLMETNNNIPGSAVIVHAHKNYIFYVSADDPKKLFFSKIASPESYPSVYYKLFPGDIVSVRSYFNYLIVSGHNYTKAVEGSVFGGVADDTVIRDLDDIGALSHEGLADCIDPQFGNVLAYPTPYGIGYITPGIQEKSLSRIPLSKDVQPYFDQAVNRQNTAGVFADSRYLVAINSPQSTYNDLVLCYDFRTKKWNGVWTLKASGFCVANRKVYMASSTEGVIYEMFNGTSDAGEKINYVLDTLYTTTKYGANYKKKFLQAWIAVSDDSVTDTMTVRFKVDNQGGTVQPGSKSGWNVGTWSGDIYGKQNAILSPKLKIPAGKGYYYGVRIEDDSTNPFTVFAIITEFEPPILGD